MNLKVVDIGTGACMERICGGITVEHWFFSLFVRATTIVLSRLQLKLVTVSFSQRLKSVLMPWCDVAGGGEYVFSD